MRIAIIGSTGLTPQMYEHKAEMEARGHEVQMPVFDNQAQDEVILRLGNRRNICWAEQIHLLWDGRSPGTILDLGMVFALDKPLKIIYLEQKSIPGMVKKYAEIYDAQTF